MSSPEDQGVNIYFEDMILFLSERRPNQKCSVCGQSGGWKFHAEAKEKGQNPKMIIFEMPVQSVPGKKAWVESVCIECPKCANINFLGAAAILQFTAEQASKNG